MEYFKRFDLKNPSVKEFFSLEDGKLRCIIIKFNNETEVLNYYIKGDKINEYLLFAEKIDKETFDKAKSVVDRLNTILRYNYFNL